jgi:hypothetical protein
VGRNKDDDAQGCFGGSVSSFVAATVYELAVQLRLARRDNTEGIA